MLLTGAHAASVTPPRLFTGLTLFAVPGDALIELGAIETRVPARSVIFLGPYEVHAWRALPSSSDGLRTVHLSPAAARDVLDGAPADEPWADRRLAVIAEPRLFDSVTAWHAQVLASPVSLMEGAVVRDVLAAYQAGARNPTWESLEHRAVTRVLRFMHRERPATVGMRQLSEVAELSQAHFSRLFAAGVGLPPIAYYKQVRLAWGRERLAAASLSSSVAKAEGFSDQSHFTRDFARANAVTPGRFSECLGVARRAIPEEKAH